MAEGLVSGYPDETFKPNKPVTRAEMAALLTRTGDSLLVETGAVKVEGIVVDISFGSDTVTDTVYGSTRGSISIETELGSTFTFTIAKDLMVGYYGRYIRAEDIMVGDLVEVTVQDGTVIEALIEPARGHEPPKKEEEATDITLRTGIEKLEIKVKLDGKSELKVEYKQEKGKVEASIEKKMDKQKEEYKGEAAIAAVKTLIEGLTETDDLDKQTLVNQVQLALGTERFSKMEIEIKFSNGKEIKVELENEDE